MLSEKELAAYIDLGLRQQVVDRILGYDSRDKLQELWKAQGITPPAPKTLPKVLWGIVPLSVPVAGPEGDETALVESNATTVLKWESTGSPALMAVDYVDLTGEQIGHYSAYLTSYLDYLSGVRQREEAVVENLKNQLSLYVDMIQSYFFDDVPKTERRRLAKTDPFTQELTQALHVRGQTVANLGRVCDLLELRAKECSRDLERRRQGLLAGTAGNWGSGVTRGLEETDRREKATWAERGKAVGSRRPGSRKR